MPFGYPRLLWREAVRNWRARFKSEGARLVKYIVGFAFLFALAIIAPPLGILFGKWQIEIKWQVAAAAVTASVGMLILSFLLDMFMAPYRVHQCLSSSLKKNSDLMKQII